MAQAPEHRPRLAPPSHERAAERSSTPDARTGALQRLVGWVRQRLLGATRAAAEPSPIERVLAQRQQLLCCALQLLDDEAAAQQVTLDAIQQALRSPMLVPLASGTPGTGGGAELAAPAHASGALPSPDAALAHWLERLVINLSLQRLKALSTLGRISSSESWPVIARDGRSGDARDGRSGAEPQAGGTPSRPEESTQLTRASQVLSQLPAETRVTVMLVVMQGRSPTEVAELLGCSELTCRFWLSHGRKLLRRALQRDLIEDDLMSRESRVLVSPGALHDLRRNKKAAARA